MQKIDPKKCTHHYAKQYINGMQTGDNICIYCGDCVWRENQKKSQN